MFKNLEKVHWFLIAAYSFLYTIAVYTTWYSLTAFPNGMFFERNPVAAQMFTQIGILPTFSLLFFVTLTVMLVIPIIFRPSPSIGIVVNSVIVIIIAFDAGNNIFQLTDSPFLSFADQGMRVYHNLIWGRL